MKLENENMPTMKIPTPLRPYTNGQAEVLVQGATIGDVMNHLVEQYPPLKPHLFNGDTELRPFVNVFVGGHSIKDLDGLKTPLDENARVLLVPSIAGG